jgi:hypothetical protein
MEVFQPEPIYLQQPKSVPLIESQYDYYEAPKQYQAQPAMQTQVPLGIVKDNTVTIIAIVGILGLFGLLAFLAFMKR